MKIKASLFISIFLLLLTSCSEMSMRTGESRDDLYSDEFIKELNQIKGLYKRGRAKNALKKLQAIKEEKLLPTEKSLRRNLMGIIYFGQNQYEQAILNFDQALLTSHSDENLTAQISLNLASSYYKMNMVDKAYGLLKNAPFLSLRGRESVKFHKLRYKLAQELGHDREALISLIYALGNRKKVSELRIDPLYETLVGKFRKLSQREKYRIFEEFEEQKLFVIGYLSYLEAEKVYYSGERSEAEDLIEWIEDNFSDYPEITTLINSFSFRADNYTKLNQLKIGVVLPLSGDSKSFAHRALLGIDSSLREFKKKHPDMPAFRIVVKDSQGSAIVGASQVKDLVEKDFVSVVIGGLYPNEALKEYESAKRRGAFFISLSQVFMDREDKNHLLLEVPGSVESQIHQLFSQEVLSSFGSRAAIIYPESRSGVSYANEFWRRATLDNVSVKGVYSYGKKSRNFRAPIQNLLGLKYTRERQEEFELLKGIHDLESNRTIRRIQTLGPQIDFDWVFMPITTPLEAVQVIPFFKYYDAKNIPIIGVPSWRSKRLSKASYKFYNIYFVGDDVQQISKDLSIDFYKNYGTKFRLIELRSFDSMSIALDLLSSESFQTRDELDVGIRSFHDFKGKTGLWSLKDGIWLKKMANLHFKRGQIRELRAEAGESRE